MAKFKNIDEAKKSQTSTKPARFCLIYGPDRGINKIEIEYFINNLKSSNPNLEIRNYNEDEISNNFASFEESIMGSSLFGGANIAVVNIKNDALASKISLILEENIEIAGGLFINGLNLTPTSKIVKAFDASKKAICVRLYAPTKLDFINIIKAKAQKEEVNIPRETIDKLIEISPQDSQTILAELENLCLYVGKSGTISINDLMEICAGGRAANNDEIINFAFSGQQKHALIRVYQALSNGASEINILNAIMRRILLLQALRSEFEKVQSADMVVKDRKFNIFWKEQDIIKKQIAIWNKPALDKALQIAIKTDIAIKKANSPSQELIEKLIISLSSVGK